MTATAQQPAKPADARQPEARPAPTARRPVPVFNDGDNPWDKHAAFLVSRGWKFRGNPNSPNSRWFSPEDLDERGQPRGAYEKKEPHTIMKNVPDTSDPEGKKTKQVPHMTFDRVHVYPAPMGISRDEAVQAQLDKEWEQAPAVS